MRERQRDVGWIGVLAGMIGVAVLVLAILLALGARIARGPSRITRVMAISSRTKP